jgi:Zn-finger nucleic acid-binding protein
MFAMNVETLNCPMCGASVSSDAPQCRFCEARLATVSCPSCFGMMFLGSKHCPRCGAAAVQADEVSNIGKECPRCKAEMISKSLGDATFLECPHCLGLWLNVATFEKICADREQHSSVLGVATLAPKRTIPEAKVTYIRCPECSELMNRANFARCSGVIVDLCKRHGIWFDREELSRIIEFIREGGLELSRAREKAQLDEQRRQLEQTSTEFPRRESTFFDSERNLTGIASTRSLLKFLLR